jgi:NTE family protein
VEVAGEHFLDGGLVRSVPVGRAAELGARRIFVLHVGRLEQPLRPPTRPWQVALVAFEIARRHQFAEEMASLPQGVEVHVLPSGSTTPALTVRYRSTSGVRGRIDAAYDAASTFLDAVSHR